jgi:hypothetical protein
MTSSARCRGVKIYDGAAAAARGIVMRFVRWRRSAERARLLPDEFAKNLALESSSLGKAPHGTVASSQQRMHFSSSVRRGPMWQHAQKFVD